MFIHSFNGKKTDGEVILLAFKFASTKTLKLVGLSNQRVKAPDRLKKLELTMPSVALVEKF
jgi:hypothetical protein